MNKVSTVFPVSCAGPAVGLVDHIEVEERIVVGGGDPCCSRDGVREDRLLEERYDNKMTVR